MADDRNSRDKQAQDEERRQQERAVLVELERGDETEPPADAADLDTLGEALGTLSFPATGNEVVAAVGDRTVESPDGTYTVAELVPATDEEAFDAPETVRLRVQRPTVAAAMKRITEAIETASNTTFDTSQREAYERTFRALTAIDPTDDDEGIGVVSDWAVERIHETGSLPGSRKVRQRAAAFCRANDYSVRDDGWLGA